MAELARGTPLGGGGGLQCAPTQRGTATTGAHRREPRRRRHRRRLSALHDWDWLYSLPPDAPAIHRPGSGRAAVRWGRVGGWRGGGGGGGWPAACASVSRRRALRAPSRPSHIYPTLDTPPPTPPPPHPDPLLQCPTAARPVPATPNHRPGWSGRTRRGRGHPPPAGSGVCGSASLGAAGWLAFLWGGVGGAWRSPLRGRRRGRPRVACARVRACARREWRGGG